MTDIKENIEDENIKVTIDTGADEIEISSKKEDINEKEQTADEVTKLDEKEDKKDKKSEKKGLFGKKPDKKDEQIKELQDKYTRQLAEFENFRKRNEAEKSKMYEAGMRDVIKKLLPIVDNFERGLSSVPEDKKEDSFVVGMDQVYKSVLTTLEELEVEPIKAVGESFDPNLHNAVMHVEDENYGENIVAEEMMKGYKFRDTVVRYSMVKVAN